MSDVFPADPNDRYAYLELAYFVYGTLRPGHGNSHCWRYAGGQAILDGACYVTGFEMYARGVPFAVQCKDPDSRVYGALIIPPRDWEQRRQMRQNLDSLEGYPTGYDRLMVEVQTDATDVYPTVAWIYSPTQWDPSTAYQYVKGGDYSTLCKEREEAWR